MKTTKKRSKKLATQLTETPVARPPADPWPSQESLSSSRGGRPKSQLTKWRDSYLVEFAGWEARVKMECHARFADKIPGKAAKAAAKYRYAQIPALRTHLREAWFVLTDRWGVSMREFPPSRQQIADLNAACVEVNPYVRHNGLELIRRKGACALGKGYTLEEALLDWLGFPRNWIAEIEKNAGVWRIPQVAPTSIF